MISAVFAINFAQIVYKKYDFCNFEAKLFARYAEPSKTLLLTMITALGVKTNMYSSVVQKQITLHDLFQ